MKIYLVVWNNKDFAAECSAYASLDGARKALEKMIGEFIIGVLEVADKSSDNRIIDEMVLKDFSNLSYIEDEKGYLPYVLIGDDEFYIEEKEVHN